MDFDAIIESILGPLGIQCSQGSIHALKILPSTTSLKKPQSHESKECMLWLNSYFKHPKSKCPLPVSLSGSSYQLKVWAVLKSIEPGEVLTYGQIAKTLKSCAQAVGGACKNNPCAIIVPCHRVISQVGLGGYMGQTDGEKLSIKSWLLNHEGSHCFDN